MELYIWFFITLSANILIFNFSCFFKQLPPFRVVLISAILLCICYKKFKHRASNLYERNNFLYFSRFLGLYLTLATIKTSEFSTLGRCFLKRVRFRYVTNHLKRRHYRVCSPAVLVANLYQGKSHWKHKLCVYFVIYTIWYYWNETQN